MKLNREALLIKLQAISAGLSNASHAPEQSECIVFDAGQVMSYNSEVAVRSPSGLNKKMTFAIRAKAFLNLLQKMDIDEIDLELLDNKLLVTGKQEKISLGIEKKIELDIDSVGTPKHWHQLPEHFTEAIELVGTCCEKEKKDCILTQTFVHIAPNHIEAWGKNRLARYSIKTNLKEPIDVRYANIKHILPYAMREFGQSDSYVHFRGDRLTFAFRRYLDGEEGNYPKLDRFFEGEVGKEKIKLPKGLEKSSLKASVVSSENEHDDITIQIRPGKMRVLAEGLSGDYKRWHRMKSYKSEGRDFLISPKLMSEIAKNHSDVSLTKNCMRIDGERLVYLISFSKPSNKGDE